eukprot:scaffold2777_cov119-Skeletonema_menzelii.AAC.1
MVTLIRTLIHITPSEASTLAAKKLRSSAEGEANSIIKNAPIIHAPTHSSNGNGNYVELPVGFGIIRVQQRGGATPTPTQPAPVIHNPTHRSNENQDQGEKKRALPSPTGAVDNTSDGKDKERKKRQRADGFVFDLSDVPPQAPIFRSKGHMKEGASKYTGVSFNKGNNKWEARITIDGKQRYIDYYENEEEAAVDYARAFFKYNGQEALDKAKRQRADGFVFDLSDVPPLPPIFRKKGHMIEGTSKYAGVYFNKSSNKWYAQIFIDGKKRSFGYYENEEEAAVDYARAVFKYKGQDALDKARQRISSGSGPAIDLSDVPPQTPIPKRKWRMKEGASKYTGVSFNKANNKWMTQIFIGGKLRYIGCYEKEEDAAVDYARAVFKYKGQQALDEERESTSGSELAIDLSDVPPQPPILKSEARMREGASKYVGVHHVKGSNRWLAKIFIDGKDRTIGYYDNEEEAAVDYARIKFLSRDRQWWNQKSKLQTERNSSNIDSSDVPQQQQQPPIPNSDDYDKGSSSISMCTGVTFERRANRSISREEKKMGLCDIPPQPLSLRSKEGDAGRKSYKEMEGGSSSRDTGAGVTHIGNREKEEDTATADKASASAGAVFLNSGQVGTNATVNGSLSRGMFLTSI